MEEEDTPVRDVEKLLKKCPDKCRDKGLLVASTMPKLPL